VKKAAQRAEQDKATEARAKAELIRRALDLEEKWHKQVSDGRGRLVGRSVDRYRC